MNKLIIRLLSRHISVGQLVGFTLANLVGLVIILLGVQFYQDATSVLGMKDRFMRGDYVIISKEVRGGVLAQRNQGFSEREIRELESQPFARAVGRFTPSKFQVSAGLSAGLGVSTTMFFEAVPDAFLDVSTDDWHYSPGSEVVPIIIPRNYLGLYNSAFAQSQGLPLLSEGSMSKLPLRLDLSSGAEHVTMQGRIVGFSNRLNTLLVPLNFLEAMNERLAPEARPTPTRLIVEVTSPASPELAVYLRDHGYQTEGDKAASGESMFLLRLVLVIVLSVGVLISVLSIYLLLLSIYLLLQKNTRQLENLLLLGYRRGQLVQPYVALTVVLGVVVLIVALVAVILIRGYYLGVVERLLSDVEPGSLLPTILVGLALLIVTSLINALAIRHRIHRLPLFAR